MSLTKFLTKHGKRIGKSGGKFVEDVDAAAKAAAEHGPRLKKSGGKLWRDVKAAGKEAGSAVGDAEEALIRFVKRRPLTSAAVAGASGAGVYEAVDDDEDEKKKPKRKRRPYLEEGNV